MAKYSITPHRLVLILNFKAKSMKLPAGLQYIVSVISRSVKV